MEETKDCPIAVEAVASVTVVFQLLKLLIDVSCPIDRPVSRLSDVSLEYSEIFPQQVYHISYIYRDVITNTYSINQHHTKCIYIHIYSILERRVDLSVLLRESIRVIFPPRNLDL